MLSWKTHGPQLREVYRSLNPQIILINGHGCKREEELKIYNYFIMKTNTTNKAHDGVAIGVRRDVSFERIDLQKMMAVKIWLEHEE